MVTDDIRTVDLPQGRIAYRESGTGESALFVHGWPVSSLTWRKVTPALEESHRCIAVDLMGAGETVVEPDADLSVPAQAGMLTAFLDALNLQSVKLIAHDSGATIARALASEQPQRFSRFVLFDTEVPGHTPMAIWSLQRAFRLPGSTGLLGMLLRARRLRRSRLVFGNVAYDHRALDLDEMFATITGPLLAAPERLRGAMRFVVQFDMRAVGLIRHERLTMPKMVLWGERDAFFPLAKGRELYERLPEPKRFVPIARCGVFPQEERPVEWLATVQPFLAG